MPSATQEISAVEVPSVSKKGRWAGRIISALVVLFLVFDGVTKVLKLAFVMAASAQFGYPERLIPVIGTILLIFTAIYVIPRTSILGALLLTGYLGGAVEAQLRIGSPLFSQTLFPVYFCVFVWAGLLLRDARLRAVFLAKN